MGKKKSCFGVVDHVCMVKDCPYMSDCIRTVWEKKMEIALERARLRREERAAAGDPKAVRAPRKSRKTAGR